MNGRGCRRKELIIVSVSRFCRYCVIVIKMYYIVVGRENEYFFVLVNEDLFLELCHPITVSIRSTVRCTVMADDSNVTVVYTIHFMGC